MKGLRNTLFQTALFCLVATCALGDDGLRTLPQAMFSVANVWKAAQQFNAGLTTNSNITGVLTSGAYSICGDSTCGAGISLYGSTNATPSIVSINAPTIVFSGAPITLPKLAAAPTTAPGANKAFLYMVAGTNAGTGKFQIMVGTSTTPSTVLDNIGSGF